MKSGKIVRYVLFSFFLIALSCSFWSTEIRAFQFDRLDGSVEKKYISELNIKNWFSGEYQNSIDEYCALNNHLSPFFIKLNNQLNYSLFTKLSVDQCIIGKDMFLFHSIYVNTYYGRDFIGEEKLREYVQKMKFLQDTLQKLNKEFIYIQAPGKASHFAEYIPDSLKNGSTTVTNYVVLSKLLKEYNINHIDFVPYFFKLKDTSAYPLFTQTGIHWSRYAVSLAMDSINNMVEKQTKADLPDLYWDHIEVGIAKDEDKDIESILNLMWPMSNIQYGYPELKFESHENKDTPRVLMVGDSYLGHLYYRQFYDSYDSSSQFWYYNSSILSYKWRDKIHKQQLDQIEAFKNSDVIIVGCTEHNIEGRSWDFVDKFYSYYKYGIENTQDEIDFMKRADSLKAIISSDTKYLSEIEMISQTQKISMDSAWTVKSLWMTQAKK